MFTRVQDFMRNRRRWIIAGVVFGGAIVGIRYAQHRLLDFQERKAREFLERTRRLQHFESTEATCNQVIFGMSNELYQAILRECSTDEILDKLHQNPSNKIELWEEMKSISFTRLISFIYASSILVIILRIQMNVLGGYLYRDITLDEKRITDDVKEQYLSFVRNFLSNGIQDLIKVLRQKVDLVLRNVPLNKRLSIDDIEQIFWSLQIAVNGDRTDDPNSNISKYVLPTLSNCEDLCRYPLLEKMYTETLDLLESSDVSSICASNVSRGFTIATENVSTTMDDYLNESKDTKYIPNQSMSSATNSNTSISNASSSAANVIRTLNNEQSTTTVIGHTLLGSASNALSTKTLEPLPLAQPEASTSSTASTGTTAFENIVVNNNKLSSSIIIPLAKLIPIISGITDKGFDANEKPQNLATLLMTLFVVSERCKTLGANVYETFSSSST